MKFFRGRYAVLHDHFFVTCFSCKILYSPNCQREDTAPTGRSGSTNALAFGDWDMKLSYVNNGKEYSVDTETLGPDALAYLLMYGFRQSEQDSIAGRALKVRNEYLAKAKEAGDKGEFFDSSEDTIQAAIAQDLDGALTKRRDAIQAGTIKVGGSAQRDPFGTLCWNIAQDMVVAAFKKKHGKGPKRDDAFEALVDQCLEKHRDPIEAEAKRRQSLDITVDLD